MSSTGPAGPPQEPAAADALRARIRDHLTAYPGLTIHETARALRVAESSVRRRLNAMQADGEARGTTQKRPGDSKPTTRWTAT